MTDPANLTNKTANFSPKFWKKKTKKRSGSLSEVMCQTDIS